ncbi:MAG TPA: NrfD/PsrC family molybdoenzyme membrane anchor subunit [Solirubrobacteraceae bacterium]|nr:NrfD/PsrC family molybdoenzyme membrane anchor subunit [Solirubrobacteraceae bacterium]
MTPNLHPRIERNGKPVGATSWDGSITQAGTEMRSYYGRPVIKPPVWEPEVPMYFFTGGLGAASALFSLATRLLGRGEQAKRMLYVGFASDLISPALLTADLGRPERFLNMLRVFKVTSPMSVGSWVLVGRNAASATAAALQFIDRAPRIKLAGELGSAALAPPLATYTAVLIANTAVPAWHAARHYLPFAFAAGSAASAGGAAVLVGPFADTGPARRLAVGGSVAALAVTEVMEKRLGLVGKPYSEGLPGKLHRASKLLTAGGSALLALRGKRSRGAAVAGAAALTIGEVLFRFAIFKAGDLSARDPRYTVEPQRERVAHSGTRASVRTRDGKD